MWRWYSNKVIGQTWYYLANVDSGNTPVRQCCLMNLVIAMFDVMVNSRTFKDCVTKFKDFQAPVLFSSTFKALNLGEKIEVLSRMRGNPKEYRSSYYSDGNCQGCRGYGYLWIHPWIFLRHLIWIVTWLSAVLGVVVCVRPSVCTSVCPSQADTLPKRLNAGSPKERRFLTPKNIC